MIARGGGAIRCERVGSGSRVSGGGCDGSVGRAIVPAMTEHEERGESHQTFATVSKADPEGTRRFAVEAARLLKDDRCEDIKLLDVRGLSQVCDYLIIGSGTSDRQIRSTGDDVKDLASKMGCPVFRRNEDGATTWLVLDCVDVVVHLFEPNTRAHYDLEMLWGDAPRVSWERSAGEAGSS